MRRRSTVRPVQDFNQTESMTEQHHGKTVKIQSILSHYEKTGQVPHMARRQPFYADMTSAPNYYEAQCIVAEARSTFEEIPSQIRKQFDNDPGQFLEFIGNPENKAEMAEMGFDVSHIPEDFVKPLSEDEEQQVHLEDLIERKLADKASQKLSEASPELLRAELNRRLKSESLQNQPKTEN